MFRLMLILCGLAGAALAVGCNDEADAGGFAFQQRQRVRVQSYVVEPVIQKQVVQQKVIQQKVIQRQVIRQNVVKQNFAKQQCFTQPAFSQRQRFRQGFAPQRRSRLLLQIGF